MALIEINLECASCGNELKAELQDANFLIIVTPCSTCMANGQQSALESFHKAVEQAITDSTAALLLTEKLEKIAKDYDIL